MSDFNTSYKEFLDINNIYLDVIKRKKEIGEEYLTKLEEKIISEKFWNKVSWNLSYNLHQKTITLSKQIKEDKFHSLLGVERILFLNDRNCLIRIKLGNDILLIDKGSECYHLTITIQDLSSDFWKDISISKSSSQEFLIDSIKQKESLKDLESFAQKVLSNKLKGGFKNE